MRSKTHQSQHQDDHDDDFNGEDHNVWPPKFTKSPSLHSKKMLKSKKPPSQSPSSSTTTRRPSDQMNGSNPAKWSLTSLMAAFPFSPSPICSTPTHSQSSPSSPFPPRNNFSRASAEFYTPTHQISTLLSSLSFKKQEQSPKCMSISTAYESAMDQGFKVGGGERIVSAWQNYTYSPNNVLMSAVPVDCGYESSVALAADDIQPVPYSGVLPCVVQDRGYSQKKRGTAKGQDFARAQPVTIENEEFLSPVNRPRPYQEFLEEVQKHKHRVELDARRKAAYANLLNKLKKKEAAIDCWESSQRSKAELQLDTTERKLDNKRAKAVKKMHQKVAKAKMEAESWKARERRSVLKEMAKLSQKPQRKKIAAAMLCYPLRGPSIPD